MIENIDILRLIIAILATVRLSRLLPKDDGPLFLFEHIRAFVDIKAETEQSKSGSILGFWSNINEGILCGFCQGWYAALLTTFLVIFPSFIGDLFLLWQGIAGAQALLWRKVE